jgi:hypothetical protein
MPVIEVARTDTYFGLREAARWLKTNTSPQDGVMTLSKGSAQYALSFYARRDAYPYGRFRLATVFPGPKVRSPRPSPDGTPSADWVTYWPPKLIRDRKVSYLVYYTDEGDDPPENPLVDNEHQERFRRFIESYGGQLMHVVYRNHEGRAWIYKVTKLYARPRITYEPGVRRLTVRGRGFRFNSRVTLYYRQKRRGAFYTDANGQFTARIPMPYYVNPRYFLIATDDFGNYASKTGLQPTLRNRRARRRLARNAQGSEARPGAASRPEPARGGLAVKIDMPDAVQVGSALPMRVRVSSKSEGLASVPQAKVFFRITSLDGKTPVRLRQRTSNTLGLAYMNLAAIELPGFYKLSIIATKGDQRGQVARTFKVRRR